MRNCRLSDVFSTVWSWAKGFGCRTLLSALPFALGLSLQANGWALGEMGWSSLYNGSESNFSRSDRSKVLRALKAYGIDHRENTRTQEIFVRSENRNVVQDLVAQAFKEESNQNE